MTASTRATALRKRLDGPLKLAISLALMALLLAARRDTLVARDVRFDERFLFFFYDLDFCRTARARGLKLGTWPLAVTHQSGGAFGSPGWKSAYQTYLAKWETSRKPA